MSHAAFGEIWAEKAAGRTVRGRNAVTRARRRMIERGARVGPIEDVGLVALLREGVLVVVTGSSTALLDAEVTISDESFERRRARLAKRVAEHETLEP